MRVLRRYRFAAMSKAVSLLLLATALGAAAACASESAGPTRGSSNDDDDADASPSDLDAGVADGTHRASAELLRCAIGRKEPTSIPDQITRINALVPADGPCIVASLPRPISIVATRSRESAQPAGGDDSPRLFFVLPKLVVAAVPSGQGSHVIELGERASSTRSVKGELEIPVTAALPADAAFTRVLNRQGIATSCGTCHGTERSTSTPKAFVSDVIQPRLDMDVPVEQLSAMHDRCVTDADPSDRCAMLHAVFDVGVVKQGSLAPD